MKKKRTKEARVARARKKLKEAINIRKVLREPSTEVEDPDATMRQLGDEVNRLHEDYLEAVDQVGLWFEDALTRAIKSGERLTEIKQQVREIQGYGEWLSFLKQHTTLSRRTAQFWMQLARNQDQLNEVMANSAIRNSIAHLTVREAAEILREKKKRKPKPIALDPPKHPQNTPVPTLEEVEQKQLQDLKQAYLKASENVRKRFDAWRKDRDGTVTFSPDEHGPPN